MAITISFLTEGEKLIPTSKPVIASGDRDTVTISVAFDSSWDGYAKSGVFMKKCDKDHNVYEAIMDSNNSCIIPHEALDEAGTTYIGIRGVNGASVYTSSLVAYRIDPGAPEGTTATVPPTASVYQQLLTANAVLSSRVDQIASLPAGGTSGDAELRDIRVKADGTTASTAGNAVREQVSQLSESIVEIYPLKEEYYGTKEVKYTVGGYIKTGVAIGTVIDMTPISNASYAYAVSECKEGDCFTVSGGVGSSPRVYAFVDSDYKLLKVDDANRSRTNEFVIAPSNSAYAIFDSDISYTYGCIKGMENFHDDLIHIGKGQRIQNLGRGFEYALAQDKGVVIAPGVYDLNQEGFTINMLGLVAPKKVYGYGATIKLTFPQYSAGDPNCSAINMAKIPSCEIYGLTIICENARYCIHDELYNYDADYYHHLFKDLTLIHKCATGTSGLWVAPRAIGGGLGNGGLIEIVNCKTYSVAYEDINYHSKAEGMQTGEAQIIIKDCMLRKNASISPSGTSTDYMNRMIVSNCISGKNVPDTTETNFKRISFNNKILTGSTEFDEMFGFA